ncbi:hypothetical protein SUGI_0685530 [Cryptomeria japonica]|nr:hypothetical protein SUGI_0685530 [Cryptomeria japonica]
MSWSGAVERMLEKPIQISWSVIGVNHGIQTMEKLFFEPVMALTMDSLVGPFLRGGLAKLFMTPSEPAHWSIFGQPEAIFVSATTICNFAAGECHYFVEGKSLWSGTSYFLRSCNH